MTQQSPPELTMSFASSAPDFLASALFSSPGPLNESGVCSVGIQRKYLGSWSRLPQYSGIVPATTPPHRTPVYMPLHRIRIT